MSVVFNNEINANNVHELIQSVEQDIRDNGKCNLYFCSTGGYLDGAYILLDFLNSNSDKIALIAGGDLASCAAIIYFEYIGSKKLLDTAVIMFHFVSIKLESRETVSPNGNLKRCLKDNERINKEYYCLLKRLNVPKKHLKRFKKGKDDWLHKADWMKFLPKEQIDNIK